MIAFQTWNSLDQLYELAVTSMEGFSNNLKNFSPTHAEHLLAVLLHSVYDIHYSCFDFIRTFQAMFHLKVNKKSNLQLVMLLRNH